MLAFTTYILSPISIGSARDIKILPGDGVGKIGQILEEENLIRSSYAFKFYTFFRGASSQLKPGRYIVSPSLNMSEIVRLLVDGPADIEVLIHEGKTLKEVDSQFASLGLIDAGSLASYDVEALKQKYPFLERVKTLEGFLFPDTYRFSTDSTTEDIVKKLLDNFQYKAGSAFSFETSEEDKDWYNDLILASLIEREVPFSEDRRIVAGIIKKRLDVGMGLQIDATVIYAKCNGVFENCPRLTPDDFLIQSPYNTYRYQGLPPAPIANPGLDAILAARNPQNTKYWYYLSDPETKNTIFAATLAEHNRNKARYLR